jgi:ornithine cyclodeaminase
VNAIGAYRRNARELDDETIGKARIVVEDKQMACAEAGDLVIPLGAGVLDRSAIVADLPALVAGVPARTSAEEITVFKSIGVAWEDLAVAVAAVAPLALSQGSVQAAR